MVFFGCLLKRGLCGTASTLGGSYAPHLPEKDGPSDPSKLPWRSHLPASQLLNFLATWPWQWRSLPDKDAGVRALELGSGTGDLVLLDDLMIYI